MKQTLEQRNKIRFRSHAFNKMKKDIHGLTGKIKNPIVKQMTAQQLLDGCAHYCFIAPISAFRANIRKSYLKSLK